MPITTEQREVLIESAVRRDGRKCWLCDAPFEPSGRLRLTLEHLTPRSHGGTDEPENIYLAHAECNELLGDMTRREKVRFRRSLRGAVRPKSPLPAWHRSNPTTQQGPNP